MYTPQSSSAFAGGAWAQGGRWVQLKALLCIVVVHVNVPIALAVTLNITDACTASGMCSAASGKIKPYTGDISSAGRLKAALNARSFKKELILIANTPLDRTVLIQGYEQLVRQLGMAHVLALVEDNEACKSMLSSALALPSLGCAYYSTKSALTPSLTLFPTTHDMTALNSTTKTKPGQAGAPSPLARSLRLSALRDLTLLRAVRLGYKVLDVHPSTRFFEDPYTYLHSESFKEHHMMAMMDVQATRMLLGPGNVAITGSSSGGGGGAPAATALPHAALLYIAGVDPGGPVVSLLNDMVLRQSRLLEDEGRSGDKMYGALPACLWSRTSMLQDVILSAQLGRVVFTASAAACAKGSSTAATAPKSSLAAHLRSPALYREEQQPLPPAWLDLAGEFLVRLRIAALTQAASAPPQGSQVSASDGGQLLPVACKRCKAVNDILKSDCAKCPALLDPLATPRPNTTGANANPDAPKPPANVDDNLPFPLPGGLSPGATGGGSSSSGAADSSAGDGGDASQPLMPQESYVLLPLWMAAPLSARGRQGYWWPHPPLHMPRQQVIGFVDPMPSVHPGGSTPPSFPALATTTATALASLRRWDWFHARRANGGLPFSASTPDDPYPQLLALHPLLVKQLPALVPERAAVIALLRSMAVLGALTGRAVVWPTLPCDAAWMGGVAPDVGGAPSVRVPPYNFVPSILPHVRQARVQGDDAQDDATRTAADGAMTALQDYELRCFPMLLSLPQCLSNANDIGMRGLTHFEFAQAYLWSANNEDVDIDAEDVDPSAVNTLTAGMLGVPAPADLSQVSTWSEVHGAKLFELLDALVRSEVLYIRDPFLLTSANGTLLDADRQAVPDIRDWVADAFRTATRCSPLDIRE